FGIPTTGTSAHAFTLLHDTERDAFTAQVDSLGADTTLLVDTYDVREAVAAAVQIGGTGLGAVRIDSGDLTALAWQVRRQLDDLGAHATQIVVTSDLDEHAIAALAAAPVDGYGVGTSLVTGSGHPTSGFVYKLVARGGGSPDEPMVSVAKTSADKLSIGGRKWAVRRLGADGIAEAEVVGVGDRTVEGEQSRELMVPLVLSGTVVGREPVEAARERHLRTRAELPMVARQMSRGAPAVPTDYVGDIRRGFEAPFAPPKEASR
ncbi:MAG: nicotinate phosphoribosyltransferase, partial [Nocardioidaceae bacterium]